MAETLAAVGLAASIVQFIDVGCRFASRAHKIYQSGSENLGELPGAQRVVDELENILRTLPSEKTSSTDPSNLATGFQRLITGCRSLADEIRDLIRETPPPDNPRRKDATRVSYRLMRRNDDIQKVKPKLDELRQDLMIHLLALIR